MIKLLVSLLVAAIVLTALEVMVFTAIWAHH